MRLMGNVKLTAQAKRILAVAVYQPLTGLVSGIEYTINVNVVVSGSIIYKNINVLNGIHSNRAALYRLIIVIKNTVVTIDLKGEVIFLFGMCT